MRSEAVETTFDVALCEHVTLTLTGKFETGDEHYWTEGVQIGGVTVWGCGECGSPWFVCRECGAEKDYDDLKVFPVDAESKEA